MTRFQISSGRVGLHKFAVRILSRIVAGGLLFGAALLLARTLLATDRALDLTDEGFHLLAAQQADLASSYLNIPPFHWHTRPLLLLVGNDVAAFRAAGAAIIFVLSALIGASAARTGQLLRLEGTKSTSRVSANRFVDSTEIAAGSVIALLASLLFFGGLILRSPSYYWVNTVGMLIGLLGILAVTQGRIASRSNSSSQGDARFRSEAEFRRESLNNALVGFGAFFAFPGNPITAVGIIFAFFAILRSIPTQPSPRRSVLEASSWAAGFGLAAAAVGFWSTSLPQMLLRALGKPSIGTASTGEALLKSLSDFAAALLLDNRFRLLTALVPVLAVLVHRWVRNKTEDSPFAQRSRSKELPLVFLWALVAVPHLLYATIAIVYEFPSGSFADVLMPERTLIEVASYQHFALAIYRLAGPVLMAAFLAHLALLAVASRRMAAALAAAWVYVSLRGTDVYVQTTLVGAVGSRRTPYPHVGITLIVLALGVGLIHLIGSLESRQSQRWTHASRRIAMVVFLLGLVAGTGSANGYLAFLQLTGVVVAAALIVLSLSTHSRLHRWSSAAAVFATLLALSAIYTSDNAVHPYRNPPLAQAVVPVEFGPARSVVYVDRDLAESLTRLASSAEAAGWVPGTALLDLASPWVPGVPAHLGARVPQSILPTMGGFRLGGEKDVLRSNLLDLQRQSFPDAWVLITAEGDNRRGGREESLSFVQIANEVIGLDFPNNFRLIHREELNWVHVELWAPKE